MLVGLGRGADTETATSGGEAYDGAHTSISSFGGKDGHKEKGGKRESRKGTCPRCHTVTGSEDSQGSGWHHRSKSNPVQTPPKPLQSLSTHGGSADLPGPSLAGAADTDSTVDTSTGDPSAGAPERWRGARAEFGGRGRRRILLSSAGE